LSDKILRLGRVAKTIENASTGVAS
jgi:hypothetical protein